MSFDLRELYQEMIIDHNRSPRNFYTMVDATAAANGFNQLCGDKLTVYVKIDLGIVQEVSFVGSGCAISKASASLMTEALQGKTIEEAHNLFKQFHTMLTGSDEKSDEHETAISLDKLTALAGVRAYPARVKCATLAWHTFEAALRHDHSPVSTE
ncbi:MAG: SUF system NifU family Fe-S cluster assembly protein [Legionellales bacterium RIFCSPHIGHO2_12_FULL_42_9]|nr:MAG: SUF system NifU family Fe-S cluster assembly protein [Legionellales bacterium RIFCSPHIGHO2_12_FULL_42_9]